MEKVNMLDSNSLKFKYAVVADIDGTLNIFSREERGSVYPGEDILLEDVKINVRLDGSMHLMGNQINFFYNGHSFGDPLNYEELKRGDEFILDEKNVYQPKFIGISYGKLRYLKTWIEYRDRKSYEVVTSNYRITGL